MAITKTKAVIAAAGVIAAGFGAATPAGADPAVDPCQLAVTFLCRFMPIAPGLDHDIDLTQGSGTLNGESLPGMPETGQGPEDVAPAPICTDGCS